MSANHIWNGTGRTTEILNNFDVTLLERSRIEPEQNQKQKQISMEKALKNQKQRLDQIRYTLLSRGKGQKIPTLTISGKAQGALTD